MGFLFRNTSKNYKLSLLILFLTLLLALLLTLALALALPQRLWGWRRRRHALLPEARMQLRNSLFDLRIDVSGLHKLHRVGERSVICMELHLLKLFPQLVIQECKEIVKLEQIAQRKRCTSRSLCRHGQSSDSSLPGPCITPITSILCFASSIR